MNGVGKAERRLAWIEACLRLGGRFGIKEKKAYRDRFALSDGMVSRDQDAFVRLINARCGSKVAIKKRGKLEVVNDVTLPAWPMFYPPPKTTDWLEEMLGPHYEVVEPVQRAEPAPSIMREIVQAILDKRALRLRYQPRRGDCRDRVVSPHTIVHAVGRLHVRGWDHSRNAPRDFVLTRIAAISQAEELQEYVGPEQDRDWAEKIQLQIAARGSENLEAISPDFNLGTRIVRKAHAHYLVYDPEQAKGALSIPISVGPKPEST